LRHTATAPLHQAVAALSRGGEANPTPTEGSAECGHLPPHGRTVASCLSSPHLGYRPRCAQGGWAELPDELLAKVLELLQAAGQEGGLGFSQASATVRLVCAAWKAVHDALVTRLMLRPQTTDEAMGMLVLRFPAVVSIQMKGNEWRVLTDAALRAVSSLPALTSLDLTCCKMVTDAGMRAVSSCIGLTSLNLTSCNLVTDEGMRAVIK
jgi:hypothetical protein